MIFFQITRPFPPFSKTINPRLDLGSSRIRPRSRDTSPVGPLAKDHHYIKVYPYLSNCADPKSCPLVTECVSLPLRKPFRMTNHYPTAAIVDDHAHFRHTAARMLAMLGYAVILEVPNGMVFLDESAACSALPDFCLLDIEMPVMDGIVTARILRERFPQIKIVACTLGNDAAIKASMLEAGVHGFLLKQMEPEEMKKTIEEALGSSMHSFPPIWKPSLPPESKLPSDPVGNGAEIGIPSNPLM